jgi:hypothetical protein
MTKNINLKHDIKKQTNNYINQQLIKKDLYKIEISNLSLKTRINSIHPSNPCKLKPKLKRYSMIFKTLF